MEINQTVIILLIIVIFLLVAVIIALFFFAFRFLKTENQPRTQTAMTELEKKVSELKSLQSEKQIEYFCVNHETIEGVGTCSICSDTFCDKCLKNHDNLNFCPEHFRLYNENEWEEIYSVKTTADTPEEGLVLYNFKTEKWQTHQTPSYIMTHYKINLHEDIIESYVKLYVIKDESPELIKQLDQRKKGP